MAATGLEALKIWQDVLVGGNSDSLAEILTDHFVFVRTDGGSLSKDETLSWVSNTEIRLSDFEVLYENHEVAFGLHAAIRSPEVPPSRIVFFARKEGEKFSYWQVRRLDGSD